MKQTLVTTSAHLYARVAIDTPLRRSFDYKIPTHQANLLKAGMRVCVPFGRRQAIGIVLELTSNTLIAKEKLKFISEILDPIPLIDKPLLRLLVWASQYYHHPIGEICTTALVPKLRTNSKITTTLWRLTPNGKQAIEKLKNAPKQLAALQFLLQYSLGCDNLQLKTNGITTPTLKALERKNWVESFESFSLNQPPNTQHSILAEQPLELNHEQQTALDTIQNHLNGFSATLLEGVTGSGKTEVYLQSITALLEHGKQVLILIPEISLSPQTIMRFKQRFNVEAAILHSNLTSTQRLSAWLKTKHGQARIIIGTRSAVFSPCSNLGMIIVDEEHDVSFKQFEGFRYSARDVAIQRAQILNIPILLGSATPSLESLHNVKLNRYKHLKLSQRAGNAKPPEITLYDIRQQTLNHGLSKKVIQVISQRLQQGQQVMIFLNRRGYAPCLTCHACGWIASCPRCDAHLTVHYAKSQLRCHFCQTVQQLPDICEQCQQAELLPLGAGTERIEADLTKSFPNTPIIRIDSDTTKQQGSLQLKLDTINQQNACLLIGTQMLAKGHHFPKVTLVVILDADSGLYSIDFRAQERCAQLLLQVAGRAGRASAPGQVIIQTRHPKHPLLQYILQQSYEAAATHCLQERKQCHLPPFTHIALIRAEGTKPDTALNFLSQVRQEAQHLLPHASITIHGPIPAQMAKRAGHYRAQLLLQAAKRPALHRLISSLLNRIELLKNRNTVRWSLDIDPLETL